MISLMLADHQRIWLQALSALLAGEDDVEVAGAFTDTPRLLEALRGREACVLLLDPTGLDPGGAALVALLHQRCPRARIIVLTTTSDLSLHQETRELLDAGATAYISKDADHFQLLAAIRSIGAADGEPDPIVIEQEVCSVATVHDSALRLTDRQREVVRGLIRGDRNQDIAQHLGVTERTVKNYVSEIFQELDVHTRTQAAVLATVLAPSLVCETVARGSRELNGEEKREIIGPHLCSP
jgi:DNA-binding NarL/FixJ family response regulator